MGNFYALIRISATTNYCSNIPLHETYLKTSDCCIAKKKKSLWDALNWILWLFQQRLWTNYVQMIPFIASVPIPMNP